MVRLCFICSTRARSRGFFLCDPYTLLPFSSSFENKALIILQLNFVIVFDFSAKRFISVGDRSPDVSASEFAAGVGDVGDVGETLGWLVCTLVEKEVEGTLSWLLPVKVVGVQLCRSVRRFLGRALIGVVVGAIFGRGVVGMMLGMDEGRKVERADGKFERQ